jgi:hypothetical protein
MQVAEKEGCAAAPGLRQVGEGDGNAADADPTSVEQTIDAGQDGESKHEFGNEWAELREVWSQWGAQKNQVGEPTKAGSHEEKVKEPQPDSGNSVKGDHQTIGEAEAEQGRRNEAERQQQERRPERTDPSGAKINPESDQSAIDKPVDKKKKRLHQEDANDWPCLQTGISLVP